MPLTTANIIQTAKGSFNSTSGTATLPAATTAGNTVFIGVHRALLGANPELAGFDYDYTLTLPNSYFTVFRQSDTVGGETSWPIDVAGGGACAWITYEVEGLYPGYDVRTFNSRVGGMLTGETLNSNAIGSSDADVFCLSFWAAEDPSGTTAPTWASYTNSYTESQEQAVSDGTRSLGLAAAHKFPGTVGPHDTTATLTVSGGHTATGAVVLLVYRSTADPAVFLTGFGPGTLLGANVGTAPYIPLLVGTPAVVADATTASGYALEITASAATEGVGLSAAALGSPNALVDNFRVMFPGSLPAGDVDLAPIQTDGTNNWAVRYRASDSTLTAGIAGGGGTPAVGPVAVPDTWYLVERYLERVNFLLHWRVNQVAQADYALPTGGLVTNAYLGPALNAATATVRFTDWMASVTPADYPLGDCRVYSLRVDSAGTLVLTGTAANWSTYTANGTLAAWNAATALANIDEVPFTIGAGNDGLVQIAIATGDFVSIPLTSYTLLPGEVVMGARMVVLGWAASATAATLGFGFYNGTSEETLQAGTVNPGFNASTTLPSWFAKMVTLANINTQGKIDGAQIRSGRSSDANPDEGLGGGVIELAIRAAPAATGPPQWLQRGARPSEQFQTYGPTVQSSTTTFLGG